MIIPKKNTRIINWSDAYQTDPDTSSIFLHIQLNQNKWTTTELSKIRTGYIISLMEHIIQIIKEKSVLLKPILANVQQLALIIV